MSETPVKWTAAGLTPEGNALQAALLGTGDGLTFTRAAAADAEGVERLDLTLQAPCTVDGPKCRVPVLLTNAGVETGFTMTELRFYVRRVTDGAPTGEEVLYATVTDETGDPIPTAAQSPGFTIDWAFVFQYGNAGSVTVTLDPVGLVSIGMVGQPNGVAGLDDNGAVPVKQGGTGATTPQAALAALGAGVRDNLFFNGNFSIWQHYPDGRYTGVPNNNYIADGFMMLSGDGSIPNTFERQHGGGIKCVSGPPNRMKRRISNAERFNGKRMTLSCWKSTGYFEETITATDWNDETDVIGCFSADELIWIRPGQTFYWMKIEEGEGQTLFYQDDSGDYHLLPQPESDYAAQLAKCQSTLLHLGGEIAIRASYANSTGIWFFVPTPVTLRSVPIIIGTLAIRTVDGGTVYNDYTFNCDNFSDNGVFVRAIKAGGNTLTDAVLIGDAYLSAEF